MMGGYNEPTRCSYCGEIIEGRIFRAFGRPVHDNCLDDIQSVKTALQFAKAYPEQFFDYPEDHAPDDMLNEFWNAYRDDWAVEIEKWATQ